MRVGWAPATGVAGNGCVAWEGAPATMEERGIAVGFVERRDTEGPIPPKDGEGAIDGETPGTEPEAGGLDGVAGGLDGGAALGTDEGAAGLDEDGAIAGA
jgi:hypothetical protein